VKLQKYNNIILNAADKFSRNRGETPSSEALSKLDLNQLGDLVIRLLNDKNLEVSKVRPFFWSLVETYADRFNLYPFDVNKALFCYLELNDYSEETVQQLIKQLETQFEKTHGRPLHKPPQQLHQQSTLDAEMQQLRDSLKYAAMVAESDT